MKNSPPSLLAEIRKTKRKEREAAIMAMSADGGKEQVCGGGSLFQQ
jgi:hypothetical protein